MFKYTKSDNGAIEVVFIVLLGVLFLCQTLGKLITWLVGRFKYTAFNGRDIIEDLSKRNKLEDSKIKVSKVNCFSPFYSYSKKKNEFTISEGVATQTNLASNMFSLQAVAYANEENNRTFQSRWQLIGVGLLSVLPYLFFMASMLLIYVSPRVNPNADGVPNMYIALGNSIGVEVFCVVGWVVILVTIFWWMSIVNNIEINIEDLTKQLNDRHILESMNGYLKFCSYIPFSFRTIV